VRTTFCAKVKKLERSNRHSAVRFGCFCAHCRRPLKKVVRPLPANFGQNVIAKPHRPLTVPEPPLTAHKPQHLFRPPLRHLDALIPIGWPAASRQALVSAMSGKSVSMAFKNPRKQDKSLPRNGGTGQPDRTKKNRPEERSGAQERTRTSTPCEYRYLKPARLPIPPPGHAASAWASRLNMERPSAGQSGDFCRGRRFAVS
jgi:hypothetical protein